MEVLEGGTLRNLYHFTNRMKLGDVIAFIDGVKSYFDQTRK